jgi:hypothetical protein
LTDSSYCNEVNASSAYNQQGTVHITLKLSNIKHLFKEPEFDPFISELDSISGIEQIISELKPTSLKCQVRTTIILPTNQLSELYFQQINYQKI